MPMYLCRDTIRLLEASVNSISLAVTAVGLPQRYKYREKSSQHAIAIGLAGVSIELMMSAILVQAFGKKALIQPSGYYKTGGKIVEDFRNLIRSRIPKLIFLTQGVDIPSEHVDSMIKQLPKMNLIIKSRAEGLHAGHGPSRDVTVTTINDTIKFMELLSKSSRISAYTSSIPKTIEVVKTYDLIIDDLIRRFRESKSISEKTEIIYSLYLVVPELPEEEPEWIDSFDKIAVSPRGADLSFLVSTLEHSKCASLVKVSKSNLGIPAKIVKGEDALPIQIQYLKKCFTDIVERWYAYRGTANGNLEIGRFNPIPIKDVYELFSIGFDKLFEGSDVPKSTNAVDTWPLIATSLSYGGTLGPYWYFVRQTDDIGQLISYLKRALFACGKKMEGGINEFDVGVKSINSGEVLSKNIN